MCALREFRLGRIDQPTTLRKVTQLLGGDDELLRGLPELLSTSIAGRGAHVDGGTDPTSGHTARDVTAGRGGRLLYMDRRGLDATREFDAIIAYNETIQVRTSLLVHCEVSSDHRLGALPCKTDSFPPLSQPSPHVHSCEHAY